MEGITSLEVARNIRAERVRNDLTIEQLSELLNISRYTLLEYEKDAALVKASMFIKMAEVLKCNVSDFFIHR